MSNVVALDLETRLIERGRLDPDVACLTFCDDEYVPDIVHVNEGEGIARALFEGHTIVGANFAFDACCLMRAYPSLTTLIFDAYRDGRVFDVQLDQQLIDLAQGQLRGYRNEAGVYIERLYNLSALHERYGFGALDKSEDTWRLRYGELIPVPLAQWPEAAVSYAKLDALATYRVHAAQQQFSQYLKSSAAEARAALALQLQSVIGMITDEKECLEYIEETKAEIARCKVLCEDHGLIRGPNTKPASKIGSRDTKKAKERMEAVCAEHDLEVKKTKTGGICLDQEATRDSGDPVLKAYSTFTSANTIETRVTQLLEGSKGLPLQTSYVVLNQNGRTSSREPGKPLIGSNFQNVPRKGKMRQCFVPRPGYYHASIDFGMAELHTVSQCEIWLTGKSLLAEALNAKRDVHCDVGSILLDCEYEEVFANKKVGKYKVARQSSKEVNFGGWGVMSPKRLMLQTNKKADRPEDRITYSRAREIMHAWETRWEPQDYFQAVRDMFPQKDGNGLATIVQFVSERVRAEVDFPAAANTLFSGLAVDAEKAALFEVARRCYTAEPGDVLYGCRPVLYVHDEIIVELPIARASESALEITRIMVDTFNVYVPNVPVRAEPALMRRWYKDAEPVYSPTGELMCWEPQHV